MIANEVNIQLRPFHDLLSGLRSRMDALYRNGDKSLAPGYLDVRRQVDDDRWEEQKQFKEKVETSLGEIQVTLAESRGSSKMKKYIYNTLLLLAIALLGGIFVIIASDHFNWHVVVNQHDAQTRQLSVK